MLNDVDKSCVCQTFMTISAFWRDQPGTSAFKRKPLYRTQVSLLDMSVARLLNLLKLQGNESNTVKPQHET